jgi:hypothetical protein
MKKALIVLLILAVAGGLFAVDLSGSVNTGINFDLTADDQPVAATEPVKAELNFTGDGGDDWGATIGTSATRLDGNGVSVGDLNGWVQFADIFTLGAGTGQGGWASPGPWEKKVDEVVGAKLSVAPMDGLDLGIRFGYPKDGVEAQKLMNFFQEIGIGVTFGADAFSIAAGVNLYSEETTGSDMDASLYAGFKFTGLDIVTISVDGGMDNAMGKKGDSLAFFGEKLNGDVASLGWELWSKQTFGDPLGVTAGAKLTYGFDLSDSTSLGFEAGAGLTVMQDFNFDSVYAKVNLDHSFNDNVSTGFEFKLTDDMPKGGDAKIGAYLEWTVGYSF